MLEPHSYDLFIALIGYYAKEGGGMGVKEKILSDCDELQKFIILSVDANQEPIMGRVKLQKMIFMLSNIVPEVAEQSSYDADNFGPYSEVVDSELEYLENVGVLLSGRGEIATTGVGRVIAKELVKGEDESVLSVLCDYKDFLNDLPSKELLAYIYSAYPDMTSESTVLEEIKPNMERYLLSLVRKQKISSQRAAELLNLPHNSIIKRMNKSGMTVLR